MKEESKLFQFLDGLDDSYSSQRSQLLLLCPLPAVEMAYAAIQQEEAQRDVLSSADLEINAMYSRGNVDKLSTCPACGGKGHSQDKCWSVVGYPKWHYKNRKPGQKLPNAAGNKWSGSKGGTSRMANMAAHTVSDPSQEVKFTSQQLEHLLKLIPSNAVQGLRGSDTEDELDTSNCFSGMVTCNLSFTQNDVWIIDSGASNHMTADKEKPTNVREASSNLTINLPTGAASRISHIGDSLKQWIDAKECSMCSSIKTQSSFHSQVVHSQAC